MKELTEKSLVTASRADLLDAKFLAAIDTYREACCDPQNEYAKNKRREWEDRFNREVESDERVLIARLGGLYAGYLAVKTEEKMSRIDIVTNPFCPETDQARVIEKLLQVAGLGSVLLGYPQLLSPSSLNDAVPTQDVSQALNAYQPLVLSANI